MGQPKEGPKTVQVLAEADDCPICWICLDGPAPERPLVHPCRCPSWTHAHCIARWQLQSAGTKRETHCDFCCQRLPDWKDVLTPNSDTTSAPAVMNVNFDNKTYSFTVAPGSDGYRQFTQAIRKAFHLPEDSELNITFTCDEPSSGSLLTLSGPGAYDAAVHCAAVSAARRSSVSGADGTGGDRAQVAPGGAAGPHGACPCPPRVRAPRASTSGGASTSGSVSPRSEAGEAPGAAPRAGGFGGSSTGGGSSSSGSSSSGSSSSSSGTGATAPRASQDGSGRRASSSGSEGGMSLGRKLRNALSDMLIIR